MSSDSLVWWEKQTNKKTKMWSKKLQVTFDSGMEAVTWSGAPKDGLGLKCHGDGCTAW